MITDAREVFESYARCSSLYPRSLFVGFNKKKVHKRKVGTPYELFARILDATARIKKSEHQPRRTTRDLRTGVAKCNEVDGGISETFIVNCNKYVTSVLQMSLKINLKLKIN
jgi:hypothetical protein